MKKHPDKSICPEGTRRVPKDFKPCCLDFDNRTLTCYYDVRYEFRNGNWGIVVSDGGNSSINISYCPHCGVKL